MVDPSSSSSTLDPNSCSGKETPVAPEKPSYQSIITYHTVESTCATSIVVYEYAPKKPDITLERSRQVRGFFDATRDGKKSWER